MKLEQVAAQLYTVREFLQTPQDIAESMKKISKIGYKAVQVSGMGPIPEEELMNILDGEGLVCCATHEPGDKVLGDPQAVVDRLAKLRCKYTAYPYPAGVDFSTMDAVRKFAAKLNASGEVLRKAGQVLTYHNHHQEFVKVDGKRVLDVIYDETDSANLQGEIDTYWVQFGGGSPTAWCKKLAGRLPLLHLKDYGVMPDYHVMFAEVGRGNLNWREIVDAAEASGCEWFIVEQDTCPGDPFESLRISFEYLRDNIAGD
jgi:sugar phosphate isomerase/epimerase